MSSQEIYWTSPPPKACDLCGTPLIDLFYDCRTTYPRWGNTWGILCHCCWVLWGVGLGLGKGQRYENIQGKWKKTGG